ncbi:plasmid replication DNA-binding protein KfrA [Luteibacter rhizovicinus]|uniref:Plasmid replication DNA-binding protein KfrA n=1 Tax=Luteibacter rhizovicinus TaxID=242606 RepID=A0A4R3YX27_9GAMM|nr:DNA-binding protein [Luteibacter rhizovicinus]TCV97725.1 plasmid replication DNA-binding protein KfrA [Luteibacter rhizovicinus]
MARGRIYKSEVQAARDKLVREGTNASLDAIRIALGNTGSKTTIHRLMKELEAEEAGAPAIAAEAISGALQALVTQLAGQLRQEAEATLLAGQARADAQVSAADAEVTRMTNQARAASEKIQRLQTTLDDIRQRLATVEQALRDRDTVIVGLRERTAGLERQLVEREAHLASTDAKHQQARDALDHFRLASKEQRAIEARQHEQAVQALQVELRRATESVANKNDELLALNRDNARLTEQAGQHVKDLRAVQRALQAAQEQAAEAEGLRQINQSLEEKVVQATASMETLRHEQTAALSQWKAERDTLSEALRDAKAQGDRWGTIESMLSSLRPPADVSVEPAQST